MRKVAENNYMKLEGLNDAIQAAMGWCDAYLWQFSDKRCNVPPSRGAKQAGTLENVHGLLLEHGGLPKIQGKAKREVLEAREPWQHVIHLPLLNGNTMEDIRDRLIKQQQLKPCCGAFSHKTPYNPHE